MAADDQRVRAMVVDDEPMARATIKTLLAADDEVDLVGEAANGSDAIAAIREERPDLVFLDVQMPGMGGFEVLQCLGEDECPAIVFTTAYDQFALKAFEVHAVDYLLKPFDDDRFASALRRAKDHLRREAVVDVGRRMANLLQTVADDGSTLEPIAPPDAPATRLTIHREGRVEVVPTEVVEWIEAADQYVRLHTARGEHLMRESMSQLESMLDPGRFLRVHRSAIVALDRVRALETQGSGVGRLQLADGTWVPVSRSRLAAVRRRLG